MPHSKPKYRKLTEEQKAAAIADPRPYPVIAKEYRICSGTLGYWKRAAGQVRVPGRKELFTPEQRKQIAEDVRRTGLVAEDWNINATTVQRIRREYRDDNRPESQGTGSQVADCLQIWRGNK